jgi:uncharacterized protein YfiM (DUF2279 family)
VRRSLGIAALVLAVATALGTAVAAVALAGYSWEQVAGYRSPYVDASLPPAKPGPPQTRRMVLVIVDGLRLDVSRKMTALETLRQHGTDLVLVTAQPSLSYPDWTTILSGAPQRVSGVTTNGFKGRVPVETLLDTAIASGTRTVVVGPRQLEDLYGAQRADGSYFRDFKRGQYLSSDLVRHAIDLAKARDPGFILLHLPDIDEAGHEFGGASEQYLKTALRVDTDLSVLANALQDANTTFVVVSDHGHIDTGGHGGWEPVVVDVPAVLAGPGAALGQGKGRLEDLAPTVAAIAGLPAPRHAVGRILPGVLSTSEIEARAPEHDQRLAFIAHVIGVVRGTRFRPSDLADDSDAGMQSALDAADEQRLASERAARLPSALGIAVGALLVLAAVAALSWRALVAALAGVAAYYAVYEALFFGVHRLAWSLSVIDSEDRMTAFFAGRLGEAALAGVVAVLVAGLVYPLLRGDPKGAWDAYRLGWLSLGPAAVLAAQATLAMQIAWYVWAWGVRVTWILPDLRLAFKYDLDLLQAAALGAVVLLAPVVTLLVGRYHPRVARPEARPSALTDNLRIPGEE